MFYVKVEEEREDTAEEPLFEGTRGANKVITGLDLPSAKSKSPERFTGHESEHYLGSGGRTTPNKGWT